MKKVLLAVVCLSLAACAGLPQSKVAQFTHKDLTAAAAYATSNGYPARAGVYSAIDAQLTACEEALAAASPKTAPPDAGVFTAFEVAAEAVGAGVPNNVKLNCEPVTIPSGVLGLIK
jgi:hypothetical protein